MARATALVRGQLDVTPILRLISVMRSVDSSGVRTCRYPVLEGQIRGRRWAVRAGEVLVLVVLLSFFAADFSAGCGHGYVFGPVTQKYARGGDGAYLIDVNGTAYEVPIDFYNTVRVGQTVRFDGTKWAVVSQPITPSIPRRQPVAVGPHARPHRALGMASLSGGSSQGWPLDSGYVSAEEASARS